MWILQNLNLKCDEGLLLFMMLPQLPLLIRIILDYKIGFVQRSRTGGTGLSQAGVVCNCCFEWPLPRQRANVTAIAGWCKPPSVLACVASRWLIRALCTMGYEQYCTMEVIFGSSLPYRAICHPVQQPLEGIPSCLRVDISPSSFSLPSWAWSTP